MDIETVELYHDMGLMPDWAYYQQNGKSAAENYRIQKQKIHNEFLERKNREQYEKDLKEKMEKELEKQLEEKVGNVIEKAMEDLLKGFK